MRLALAGVLVVLFLLLVAIMVFVSRLLTPVGSTGTAATADGLTWIRSIYGTSAAAEDQLESPVQTAIGPDGTIWVTDYTKDRILGFAPDGSFREELTAAAADGESAMLDSPAGVAVSAEGDVYVASFGTDKVIVWNRQGEIQQVISVGGPIAVAVSEDRLLVTAVDGLYFFTPEGEQIAKWASRGSAPDQVDLPNGAVIGNDGMLYICDTHNVQIKSIDPADGSVRWANPSVSARATAPADAAPDDNDDVSDEIVSESHPETTTAEPGDAVLADSLQVPTGLTQDSAGRLVFVDAFAFSIYTADSQTGEITGSYGAQGEADGAFNYPSGISYDPDRDWFAVADTANHRVQIVRLEGSGGSAADVVRGLAFPWAVCFAPLILLLLALIIALARRRARRQENEFDDE